MRARSGYTFFRADTTPRAATDQNDKSSENVYIVYDAAYGPDVPTGSTYGMVGPGTGSLSAVYYTRLDGATGTHTTPVLVDTPTKQHQLFPDIAVNAGTAHVLWWDSRNDTSCATATTCAKQPVGNTADRHVVPSLDTFAKNFAVASGPGTGAATLLSAVTTNPNYEQFADRTVPFAGDYLWIDSVGTRTYGVWTDWRDTVAGSDQREACSDRDTGAERGRRRPAVPHRPAGRHLVQRHLPAGRRTRPEHLRRPGTLTAAPVAARPA